MLNSSANKFIKMGNNEFKVCQSILQWSLPHLTKI